MIATGCWRDYCRDVNVCDLRLQKKKLCMDKSYIIKNKICEFGLHGDFKASVSLNRNKINKMKLFLDFGQLLDEHVFFAMQSSAFITLMSKHRTVNSDANS